MVKSMVLPDIEPMTPAVGAIVSGLDLREPLEPETVLAVRDAVLEHGVVFFREQDLTREQMLAFIVNFGTPCVDPISVAQGPVPGEATIHELPTRAYAPATAVWHIDSSLGAAPAALMALRAIEVPAVGGDTCWASMYAAYEALSEPMRNMLDGLTALHSAYKVLPLMGGSADGLLQEDLRSIHPVVRVHPETGRRALFANELWTERIVELSTAESDALLAFLFEHVKSPEFSIRWHWKQHDLAFWDNRSFAHHAINDYTEHRVMQKSLLAGDRPYGPR
jgi:alpha-ketoglutarate-dependent taurine dioxygenase